MVSAVQFQNKFEQQSETMAILSTDAAARLRAATNRKLKIAVVVICVVLMTLVVAYSERDISLPVYVGKVM